MTILTKGSMDLANFWISGPRKKTNMADRVESQFKHADRGSLSWPNQEPSFAWSSDTWVKSDKRRLTFIQNDILSIGSENQGHHWRRSLKVKQNNTWITNDTDHVEIIGPSFQWGSYFVQPRNLLVSWLGKFFFNFPLKFLNPWCPDTKLHLILNRNNTWKV